MKRLALLMFVFISACSGVSISDYSDASITFDPMYFFNNKLIAEGVVRDHNGKVTRSFEARINATWDENGGVLDEVFIWSDGERQSRVWQFTKVGDNSYRGTANDVIGEASMVFEGNAIQMNYILSVKRDNGKTINLNMNDWLYQVNDKVLMNVTQMKKFGFEVGEVILTMRIEDAGN